MSRLLVILSIILSMGNFPVAHSKTIDNWENDFATSINRLRTGNWENPKLHHKLFVKKAKQLWTGFKRHQHDWIPLLAKPKNLPDLFEKRHDFAKKSPYVAEVFPTKEQTLIVETTAFPNIILKIDGRPQVNFDEYYRSYFQAFIKSDFVKYFSTFSHLYLPIELGRESKEIGARVVMSEKIPLFSDAEIDNRIFLHVLLKEADRDDTLRDRVKKMYSQMLWYICKADFDDINYRNVPFAIDGRLSPFDTDSLVSSTGVVSFLQQFFGYRILDKDETLRIVKSRCDETYAANPQNILDYFADIGTYDHVFQRNEEIINNIIAFLESRQNDFVKFRSFTKEKDKIYARKLDRAIKKRLNNSNRTVFGTRCEHVSDFLLQPMLDIKKQQPDLPLATISTKMRKIIQQGVDRRVVFSSRPIADNSTREKDLSGFICF